MTHLPPEMPRRRIEPLPPPPEAFETVLRRARARRTRRLSTVAAVTGVFLAGLWGGLAMAGGVAGVQDTVVGFANQASDLVKADPPTESPTKSSAKVVPPTGGHSTSAPVDHDRVPHRHRPRPDGDGARTRRRQ